MPELRNAVQALIVRTFSGEGRHGMATKEQRQEAKAGSWPRVILADWRVKDFKVHS